MTGFLEQGDDYIPGKYDFLESAYQLVQLKEKLKSGPRALKDLIALGEQIAIVHSYIYDLDINNYVNFSEWLLTFFELEAQYDRVDNLEKSYGLPSVHQPQDKDNQEEA